jgi:hypothetical protein
MLALLWIVLVTGCAGNSAPATDTNAGGLTGMLPAPNSVTRQTSDPGGATLSSMQCIEDRTQRTDAPNYVLEFSPDCDVDAPDMAGVAYAMYAPDAPASGWPVVKLTWFTALDTDFESPTAVYVGIANFETNRWEFFLDGGLPLRPQGREQYVDGDGKMLVTVLALGTRKRTLQSVQVNPYDPQVTVAPYSTLATGYQRIEQIRALHSGDTDLLFVAGTHGPLAGAATQVTLEMFTRDAQSETGWSAPTLLAQVDNEAMTNTMSTASLDAVLLDGQPALLWGYTIQEPYYSCLEVLRASDAQGSQWNDPQIVHQTENSNDTRWVRFATVVDGRLAFTYTQYDPSFYNMPYYMVAADSAANSWDQPRALPRPLQNTQINGMLATSDGRALVFAESWTQGLTASYRYVFTAADASGSSFNQQQIASGRFSNSLNWATWKLSDGRPAFFLIDTAIDNYANLGPNVYYPADQAASNWPSDGVDLPSDFSGNYIQYGVIDGKPAVTAIATDETDSILRWSVATDADCTGFSPTQMVRLPYNGNSYRTAVVSADNGADLAFGVSDGTAEYIGYNLCVAHFGE